jgi:transposase
MDESRHVTTCVGIDVSKDRLDVHMLPSVEAFAVARDGKGLENLIERLSALDVSLIVLEATGGFETTVAAALASAGLPLAVVNRARSGILPARSENSPKPMRSTLR